MSNIPNQTTVAAETVPAALLRLRNRPDFLAANRGQRAVRDGFILLAHRRAGLAAGADMPARVGFTCSKKLGNAVTRNRAKRRLRHLANQVLGPRAMPGWDYVLIGRPKSTTELEFAQMHRDLSRALDKVHGHAPSTLPSDRG